MIHRKLIIRKKVKAPRIINEGDGMVDPVPAGSPLQTAQLIGALVIRFVWHAQSADPRWECFPDKALLEAILTNCKDRATAEYHLTALLFHHSKILDNCGTPNSLKKLAAQAFPQVIESPQWEMLKE